MKANFPAVSTKQVIVVRKDLKMQRGKEIAQASHGVLAWITRKLETSVPKGCTRFQAFQLSVAEIHWLSYSFKKVTLQVSSGEELQAIYDAGVEAGIECHLIIDSGRTVFHGIPTKTVVVLGPDWDDKLDPITGHLELY